MVLEERYKSAMDDNPQHLYKPFASFALFKSDFREEGLSEQIAEKMKAFPESRVTCIIADSLFGSGKHTWDSAGDKWGQKEFEDLFTFAS